MENRYEIFEELLKSIKNGMQITFTKDNIHPDDNFLILGCGYNSCTITLKRCASGLWVVNFDNDEPMLLENTPVSFWKSILKNI